jgi:two-component system, OmpR family, sensor histidine kinase QseC
MNWLLQKPSLWRRMLAVILGACVIVWASVYAQGWYFTHNPDNGSFDEEMIELADSAVALLDRWPEPQALRLAFEAINVTKEAERPHTDEPPDFLVFYVWTADGRLLARSTYADEFHTRPYAITGFSNVKVGSDTLRVLGKRNITGQYLVEVTQTERSRTVQFNSVMLGNKSLQVAVVAILFLLIPTWIAAQYGLKPLRVLAQELGRRAPDDLRPLISPSSHQEIAPLVTGFNMALARLESHLAKEKSFLADAAHELRTPLAVLTTQVDNLLMTTDLQGRTALAGRLKQGLRRANRLAQQLLTLASIEADEARTSPHPLDIADCIRDCLAYHAPDAYARNIECSYFGPESLPWTIHPAAFESIMDNLVGNAIRHGTDYGHVKVRAREAGNMLVVDVCDDGPGIPLQDRASIFERFRRGSNTSATGSGLGLAIVAAATQLIGGNIDFTDGALGTGTTFTLRVANISLSKPSA